MFGSWGVGGCGRLGGCECVGVGRGSRFYKKNPFKQNFRNLEMLLKKWSGVNFTKEIPLNEISEKLKILLKK